MNFPWKRKRVEKKNVYDDNRILELAHTMRNDPTNFIATIKQTFENQSDAEKADLFFQIGSTVYNKSYYSLGLVSWLNALK